jgi:hypothetical protein
MTEITKLITSTEYLPSPEAAPGDGDDIASTLAAALLRLEDEAQRRRTISRNERRRSLGMKHEAIAKERAAARTRKKANMLGASAQFAASVASTIGSFAGGGGKTTGADGGAGASGASESASNAGAWAKGASAVIDTAGQFASQQLHHRAADESQDANALEASASGLESVSKEHASSSEDAARSAERARNVLARIIDGAHAQRMAILRG